MNNAKQTKIFIHQNNGFAHRWPELLLKYGYNFQLVDAHNPSFFAPLLQSDYFLWNLNHEEKADHFFAIPLLQALNAADVKTFPNIATCWHFDDKAAQAFLLEAIGAPAAKTWVFSNRKQAEAFVESSSFPLVFKLRRGAGSINVRLVHNKNEAHKLIHRMFSRGFRTYPTLSTLQRGVKRGFKKSDRVKDPFLTRLNRAATRFTRKVFDNEREKNYVLFQEFLAGNTHDTRITVIGDRAFTYERGNRENDFRASGSGKNKYLSFEELPRDMVNIAFDTFKKIGAQTMAFDFVRDPSTGAPKILEMCYTFVPDYIEKCQGYITPDGTWVSGDFRPEELILIDLLGLEA